MRDRSRLRIASMPGLTFARLLFVAHRGTTLPIAGLGTKKIQSESPLRAVRLRVVLGSRVGGGKETRHHAELVTYRFHRLDNGVKRRGELSYRLLQLMLLVAIWEGDQSTHLVVLSGRG